MMISLNQDTRTTLLRMKYELRSFLEVYPELFFPLVQLKSTSRKLAVGKHTEIVIEGFPRSGNSFAVGAFRAAQSRPVAIATHLHAPAQVILAARKGIPTLVVIRNPVDAVLSFKSSFPDSPLGLERLLRHYTHFYTSVIPYRDKYVLGFFEEVTSDFGAVVKKINQRFNTNFQIFEHTEENVQKVFQVQGSHSGPSIERQKLREILRKQLKSDKLQLLVSRADYAYQQFQQLTKE